MILIMINIKIILITTIKTINIKARTWNKLHAILRNWKKCKTIDNKTSNTPKGIMHVNIFNITYKDAILNNILIHRSIGAIS